MRWLLVTLLLLSLGATYPRHRRFLQKNLPAGGATCTQYPATTNHATYSQDLADASWLLLGFGAAAPTVTSNAALAPSCAQTNNAEGCGTMTADRIQIPATSGGGTYSFVATLTGYLGTHGTLRTYAKGVSGAFSINFGYSSGAGKFVTCTGTAAAYTECVQLDVTTDQAVTAIGNIDLVTGNTAQDVYVWQVDSQNSATLTPPIKTTSAPVTRPAGCY